MWTPHSEYYNVRYKSQNNSKRDNIDNLCLCYKLELACLILNFLARSKLRYRAPLPKLETIFRKMVKTNFILLNICWETKIYCLTVSSVLMLN